jgi:predicted acetylornithine/succinylornithine family transaminase
MKTADVAAREAAHFIPVVKRLPVCAVEASGSRLRDVEGREYLDLTSGWGVTCIGHCHPELVRAISDQAGRLMQTTNVFYNLPQLELIERIAATTPGDLSRSFVVNSGTEAVEGALKLAHRATGRANFVSTQGSFHGRTLGALRVIGGEKHRKPYEALMLPNTLVPFGDLDAARRAIGRDVAAFIVEPVQGEGGVHPAPPGYLTGLREICDAAGALLIFDEVQTGMGRTGRLYAAEHDGVVPDLMTLGKGLGGGFPVAAFVASEKLAKTVSLGDHGSTFGGNPLACAAANAVFRVIEQEKLVERSARLGDALQTRLKRFAAEHPTLVESVRGRGLLVGCELRDAERAAAIPQRAVARGVLVNVTAGRVIRFFPALNIPEDELWQALDTVLTLVAEVPPR